MGNVLLLLLLWLYILFTTVAYANKKNHTDKLTDITEHICNAHVIPCVDGVAGKETVVNFPHRILPVTSVKIRGAYTTSSKQI